MAYQTHMDSSMVDDSAPLSDTNGIELPPDILVLHLIATGVIQLTDRVAKGMPIDSQYPVPLQIGLNRLNVIRYRHSGSLWTRVKLNCKARWAARAQAIGAAPATQEVGAVATSHSNSAAA